MTAAEFRTAEKVVPAEPAAAEDFDDFDMYSESSWHPEDVDPEDDMWEECPRADEDEGDEESGADEDDGDDGFDMGEDDDECDEDECDEDEDEDDEF